MAATISLADTINATEPFIGYVSLVIGASNQPALSLANYVKQAMLAPPFCYRWNRNVVSFLTSQGVQDYPQTGLTTFGFPESASVQKCASITSASLTSDLATYVAKNTFAPFDMVTTLGCTTAALNAPNQVVVTATPTEFTTEIQHADIISENETNATAALIQDAAGRPGIFQLEIKAESIGEAVEQDRPAFLFVQLDDNAGGITPRLTPVPDQQYRVILNYQGAAALFTATTGLWSPIPDFMQYIYNAGFIGMALDYEDDPKAVRFRQLFVAGVLANAEGLTEMDKSIFVRTWLPGANDAQVAALTRQQGVAAKGI